MSAWFKRFIINSLIMTGGMVFVTGFAIAFSYSLQQLAEGENPMPAIALIMAIVMGFAALKASLEND